MKIVLVESRRGNSRKNEFAPEFISALVGYGFEVLIIPGDVSTSSRKLVSGVKQFHLPEWVSVSRYRFRLWRMFRCIMTRANVIDVRDLNFGLETIMIRLFHPLTVIVRRLEGSQFPMISRCDAVIVGNQEKISEKILKKAFGTKNVISIRDGKRFVISEKIKNKALLQFGLASRQFVVLAWDGVSMEVFYDAFRAFEYALRTNRMPNNTKFVAISERTLSPEYQRELHMVSLTQPLLTIVDDASVSFQRALIASSRAVVSCGDFASEIAYLATSHEIPVIFLDNAMPKDLHRIAFSCERSERSVLDTLSYILNAPNLVMKQRLQEGALRIRRRFEWKRTAKKTVEFYKEAISNRRLRGTAIKSSSAHAFGRYAG